MGNTNSTASWIGKAAYEVMQVRGWNGREANACARDLADGLLDYGIDLARIDPRGWVRQHFGVQQPAATVAPIKPMVGADVAPSRLSVSHDEDGIELHIDANGLYGDRCISWDFVNAIVEAWHGADWDNGRGYSVEAVDGGAVVTMKATAARHGVTFALTRDQIVAFGNACLQAGRTDSHLDVATVDGRWGDEPTSPVVRARIAERLKRAA